MLPLPGQGAEDAFVAELSDADDTDRLVEAITAAMEARRPRLAARLVNLLDEQVEFEPGSRADRARRAARFVLMQESPDDRSWSELAEAWRSLRRSRMRRIGRRQRQSLSGRTERIGRFGRKSR